MTQQHPITPLPELVQQWASEFYGTTIAPSDAGIYIAIQATRWGADEQLEQDARWLDTCALFSTHLTITPSGDALRQAMRSKPPSLKEQALKALDDISIASFEQDAANIIRHALEQLDD